ncbi:hypothetical protein [Maribacter antarcticus]|uniref:hypothetical protein n=1 Tax=Maribacter antarcticus TaxID=505250 RepID=UPI00047D42D4|nr:hypothetical protein [Maribacter antarcticus]
MKRWIMIVCPLILMFILSGFGFSSFKVAVPDLLKVKKPTSVLFPKGKATIIEIKFMPPFAGTDFTGFKEALAFKESKGDYFAVNTFGYLGKYQFGTSTLELMGVYSDQQFLGNPVLQEKVFQINIARNKWILRRDIKRFVGKRIRGIEITESGMLAAAHLAGAGNVKRYLRSFGKKDVMDDYGTHITCYINEFSGYDISSVEAVKNPKI